MKSENKAQHHRVTMANVDRVWESRIHDYRDSAEFKAYRDEIARLLVAHKRLSVAEIHRLVAEPRRAWTMDVLELVDVIEVGILPTKYERFDPRVPTSEAYGR